MPRGEEMKNEEIYTPTEIGLNSSDCSNGNHNWEIDTTSRTSGGTATKWRCRKCLCTRYTYD